MWALHLAEERMSLNKQGISGDNNLTNDPSTF